MLKTTIAKGFIGGAAIVALGASLALADAVEDRQATMKAVGKAMGALAAIAKKEAPFDAAVVKASAETIASKFEVAKTLFPDGSEKGAVETFAKPDIWSDRAGFDAALAKAHEAAVAMAAVTEESQFGAALGALGNGCKGCHDKFRRPKDN